MSSTITVSSKNGPRTYNESRKHSPKTVTILTPAQSEKTISSSAQVNGAKESCCWPEKAVFNPCYWCKCDILSQRKWCRLFGYIELFMWTPISFIYILRALTEPFVPKYMLNKVFFGLSMSGILLSMISGIIILIATCKRMRILLLLHVALEVILANLVFAVAVLGGIIYFRSSNTGRLFAVACALTLFPSLAIYVYSAMLTFGYYTELRARLAAASGQILPTSAIPSAVFDDEDDDYLGLDKPAVGHPLGHRDIPYYAPFYPAFMMYDYHPFLHNHLHLGLGFHHHHWDYW